MDKSRIDNAGDWTHPGGKLLELGPDSLTDAELLEPIQIPDRLTKGSSVQKILQVYFDQALEIDYETIFTTDFVDGVAFPDNREVVGEIRDLVNSLKKYDISSLIEGKLLSKEKLEMIYSDLVSDVQKGYVDSYLSASRLTENLLKRHSNSRAYSSLEPEESGDEYYKIYLKDYFRSQQANNMRLSVTLWDNLLQDGLCDETGSILDLDSGPPLNDAGSTLDGTGPSLFRERLGEKYPHLSVLSLDKFRFPSAVQADFTELPFADESFNKVNFAYSLQEARLVVKDDILERLYALTELNRILRPDGLAQVSLPDMFVGDSGWDDFVKLVAALGFKVLSDYSGRVESDIISSYFIHMVKDEYIPPETIKEATRRKDIYYSDFLFERGGKECLETRGIVASFKLKGRRYKALLSNDDQAYIEEHRSTQATVDELKDEYGSLQNIPTDVLVDLGLVFKKIDGDELIVRKEGRALTEVYQ